MCILIKDEAQVKCGNLMLTLMNTANYTETNGTSTPKNKPGAHEFNIVQLLNITASINDKIDFAGSIQGTNITSYFNPANGTNNSNMYDVNIENEIIVSIF